MCQISLKWSVDTKKFWPGLRSLELTYLGLASSESGRYLPPLKTELPGASVLQHWAVPYPSSAPLAASPPHRHFYIIALHVGQRNLAERERGPVFQGTSFSSSSPPWLGVLAGLPELSAGPLPFQFLFLLLLYPLNVRFPSLLVSHSYVIRATLF